ncbi:MAG: arginyltransferase [Myxococcaceae bacterium]
MPRLIKRIVESERPCSYLPDKAASLDHRLMSQVSAADYEQMLVRGWRRFGPTYFRPACGGCGECVSIRVPVARFSPRPSQLRAARRCKRFRVTLGPAQVDEERLALYRAWHHTREEARAWPSSSLDEEGYHYQFSYPHPAGRELTFHDGDRLVALGICDVTPRAFSAVYFFYHPDIANLSPGVANVMYCLEAARAHGIPHVYLGFRVMGCPSMRYKASFRPHELLEGRPGFDEEPRWVEAVYPR